MSAVIEARLSAIEARLAALESGGKPSSGHGGKGEVASDAELHGRFGDPEGWVDPKGWDGPTMKGTPFSRCPVEWLDMAAEMYERFGDKAERDGKTGKDGKPVAWKDFQKARLARRWAQEIRAQGGKPKAPASNPFDEGDEDSSLPF